MIENEKIQDSYVAKCHFTRKNKKMFRRTVFLSQQIPDPLEQKTRDEIKKFQQLNSRFISEMNKSRNSLWTKLSNRPFVLMFGTAAAGIVGWGMM